MSTTSRGIGQQSSRSSTSSGRSCRDQYALRFESRNGVRISLLRSVRSLLWAFERVSGVHPEREQHRSIRNYPSQEPDESSYRPIRDAKCRTARDPMLVPRRLIIQSTCSYGICSYGLYSPLVSTSKVA